MDISVPLRYVPPGMDQFIIGWMQYIDSSEEAIKLSYGDKETVAVEEGEEASSNGGYYYNPGEIRAYEPGLMDKWSESSNVLGGITYSIADDLYLFAQASPFGAVFVSRSERRHLNGVFANQSEVESGFFGGLSMFMPSPVKGQSYFKNMSKSSMYSNELFGVLNSSQFGTKFKGTFLTKGNMRFTYNRY